MAPMMASFCWGGRSRRSSRIILPLPAWVWPGAVRRRGRPVGQDAHRPELLRLELTDHAQLLAQLLLLLLDAERFRVGAFDGLELRLHAAQLTVRRRAAQTLPEVRGDQTHHRDPE